MINTFKKLWKFAEHEQGMIRSSVIWSFLGAIFNVFQFKAIYLVIAAIIKQDITWQTIGMCSAFLLLSLLGIIISKKNSMLKQTHAGYFTAANKRIAMGEKIKKVPMGFFNDFSLGNLTAIATTKLDSLETWVPTLFIMVFGGLLVTVVFILSLFMLHWKIALIAIAGSLIFLAATVLMQQRSKKSSDRVSVVQNNLTKEVLATLQGMQIIKSYNLGGQNNNKLDQSFEETKKSTLSLEKAVTPYAVLLKIIIAITISVMIATALSCYFSGELALDYTIMTLVASFVIFNSLLASGSAMAMLRTIDNAMDSYDYVNQMQDMPEGHINDALQQHDIEFKNVSFAYGEKPILNNVSCYIPERSMTAIVGPSGSGKTTFCNLISRFWDVNSGEIRLGGKNIKDYSLENLMNHISMVFQDVYLFADTIENNIKFGCPNATRDDVIAAAKKAQCHDFISALPDGYQSMIGEGGTSLSGGEKQRISIARAMLKDAPIIIFDEATANVDPENEDKLKAAIEALTQNKTVIMIAHRLKTIRNANRILVLNKAGIEQCGTHDELMLQGGLYRDLIESRSKAESWRFAN
ncbi:TPA: ABC transporter ATP-binding protein [Streptococcus pyogenes]|nr:ABC transporter ATP-binding protein [Streptococcus pyogenes]